MRLLSALFDMTLLPVAAAQDVFDYMNAINRHKSNLRQQIERVEDDLS